ncbi:hypothetical protein KCP70_00825 [Salmonella enterica subsp. enterica]|nr:hypothetical protein KCP70_00825 [Salmonella enterica subsp. enterica]
MLRKVPLTHWLHLDSWPSKATRSSAPSGGTRARFFDPAITANLGTCNPT